MIYRTGCREGTERVAGWWVRLYISYYYTNHVPILKALRVGVHASAPTSPCYIHLDAIRIDISN
jgi:hypothetical protein